MPFDPLVRRTDAGLAPSIEITQGALVSGLRLPRYGSGSCFGFLITARCDLAHVRSDIVNLLPVVPLAEWLSFDGCIVTLLARILAVEERLAELSEQLSPALQDLIRGDWDSGFRLFIRDNPEVEASTKDRIRSALEELIMLSTLARSGIDSPTAIAQAIAGNEAFRKLVERERPKKLAALIENKILDAHFLPVVRPGEELSRGLGYVIMFRQILSVPGGLLEFLRTGVRSLEDLPEPLKALAAQHFVLPAEIVANTKSPYVEHILQRFSNVFGRVGVADCSSRYRDWLVSQHS